MPRSLVGGFPEEWTVGAARVADPATLTMFSRNVTAAAGVLRYSGLKRRPPGTTNDIAAGETFYCARILFRATAAVVPFGLHYADTDLGDNSAGPLVVGVNIDALGVASGALLFATLANTIYDYPVVFSVPAGKFLHISCDAASETVRVTVQGVER